MSFDRNVENSTLEEKMSPTASTFLLDSKSIKRRILLNPQFSMLLVMWNEQGQPDSWHSIETSGGEFSELLELDEYELNQLGINYEPSSMSYWCSMFYFSDLAKAFLR